MEIIAAIAFLPVVCLLLEGLAAVLFGGSHLGEGR